MAKITKKFTVEEYYKDYEFITNSQLLSFEVCPYFFQQKKEGNIVETEKDYFTYGKAVDAILSGEDIKDKFFIGTAPKKSPEEIKLELGKLNDEIKERIESGKEPLKSQITKLDKLQKDYSKATELEGKIKLTETVFKHVKETAEEISSQPLYEAFKGADTQTIIATEINGVKVKCMLDKLDLENGIIEDDKTTANIMTFDPNNYGFQLAWYRWIVREVHGVECDCYLSVGDKVAGQKRSSFYHATKAFLDYYEELNMERLARFIEAREKNEYKNIIELVGPEARESVCFKCDHYKECPYSKQTKFIKL